MKPALKSKVLLLAAAAAAALASLVPAVAQAAAPEVTVTGRYGVGRETRSLTRSVSYADLDLATPAGRAALRQRVRQTARELCSQLSGRAPPGTPMVRTCVRDAVGSVAAMEPQLAAVAPAAAAYGREAAASVTGETVTNGPVPDTPENRVRYGPPISISGRHTAPAGN
jgi:UrcA family protein